jgi:hypothetical protein
MKKGVKEYGGVCLRVEEDKSGMDRRKEEGKSQTELKKNEGRIGQTSLR